VLFYIRHYCIILHFIISVLYYAIVGLNDLSFPKSNISIYILLCVSVQNIYYVNAIVVFLISKINAIRNSVISLFDDISFDVVKYMYCTMHGSTKF